MVDEVKVWEMGEGETAKAYEAFSAYRDLGAGRSLAKAAAKVGKSERLMKKWSARHEWGTRARAYDEYLEGRSRGAYESKLVEVNTAHLDMVRSAREAVMAPLSSLLARIEKLKGEGAGTLAGAEDIPLDKMMTIARPYIKLAIDVIRIERLLYGLPTQSVKTEGNIGHSVSHDIRIVSEYIESLPDEELLRIVKNTKRRAGRNGGAGPLPRGKREG